MVPSEIPSTLQVDSSQRCPSRRHQNGLANWPDLVLTASRLRQSCSGAVVVAVVVVVDLSQAVVLRISGGWLKKAREDVPASQVVGAPPPRLFSPLERRQQRRRCSSSILVVPPSLSESIVVRVCRCPSPLSSSLKRLSQLAVAGDDDVLIVHRPMVVVGRCVVVGALLLPEVVSVSWGEIPAGDAPVPGHGRTTNPAMFIVVVRRCRPSWSSIRRRCCPNPSSSKSVESEL